MVITAEFSTALSCFRVECQSSEMSDQQVKKTIAETQLETLPPPSMVSNWCRTQNLITTVDFEWTIQSLAFLETFKDWGEYFSSEFSPRKTGDPNWTLHFYDEDPGIKIDLSIPAQQKTGSPVQVKIAISNKNREKIFPQQHYLAEGTVQHFLVMYFRSRKHL